MRNVSLRMLVALLYLTSFSCEVNTADTKGLVPVTSCLEPHYYELEMDVWEDTNPNETNHEYFTIGGKKFYINKDRKDLGTKRVAVKVDRDHAGNPTHFAVKVLDEDGNVDPNYQINPTDPEGDGDIVIGKFSLDQCSFRQIYVDWDNTAKELDKLGYKLAQDGDFSNQTGIEFVDQYMVLRDFPRSQPISIPEANLDTSRMNISLSVFWDHLVGDQVLDARGRLISLSINFRKYGRDTDGEYKLLKEVGMVYESVPKGTNYAIRKLASLTNKGKLLKYSSDKVKNRAFQEDNLTSLSECEDPSHECPSPTGVVE